MEMLPQNAEVFGVSSQQEPRSWKLEVARLVGLAGSLVLFLALVSHAASDPSLTTFSTSDHIHNWMGRLGAIVSDLLFQSIGLSAYALPIVCGWVAITLGRLPRLIRVRARVVGFGTLFLSLSALAQLSLDGRLKFTHHSGGTLGIAVASLLSFVAGTIGAFVISAALLLCSIVVLFQFLGLATFLENFTVKLSQRVSRALKKGVSGLVAVRRRKVEQELEHDGTEPAIPSLMAPPMTENSVLSEPSISSEHEAITIGESRSVKIAKRALPKKVGSFKLPTVSMLSGKAESKTKSVDKSWYLEKGNILVQKLKDFGVEGEVTHISPGPVITVYEFKPASGVKIKEIANLSDDLTLALSVLSVRIVAPIPGKPVIGIEIPSPHREMVFFKDLVNETPFFKEELKIPVALGRLASGEPIAADLASMPHLLIAGTTGTGKSVFINTLISSLLFRFTPRELKLILVDPKMVELSLYEEIPHLLLPVVVDSKKAALALRWAVEEMERRYSLLHQLGVRHIDGYNARFQEFQRSGATDGLAYMPYIVVVIDEYADLMAVVPKDVELSIARLAQKARASGIHLVLATQRPSTDVVTGTIKANFPSRISFRVASSIDSKTILDRAGAERLLGHGDLLFHSVGFMTLKRMQGPYISDGDIERVVMFLKSQGAPEYDERILQAQESLDELTDDTTLEEEGELYDRALRLVTEKGEASISLIQRHLRIGYNRAATLMEELEKNGVVAQASGNAKRRAVIPHAI